MNEKQVIYTIIAVLLLLGTILVILINQPPVGKGDAYAAFTIPENQCDLVKERYQETLADPELVLIVCKEECVDQKKLLIVSVKKRQFLWWEWTSANHCIS